MIPYTNDHGLRDYRLAPMDLPSKVERQARAVRRYAVALAIVNAAILGFTLGFIAGHLR